MDRASQPVSQEYARLHRVLKIFQLLQAQEGWTAEALARECQVTQRTVYRDLELLEGAGIPWSCDPATGYYRIRGDFFMQPVSLSLDEALAVIALGEMVGRTEQIPFTQPAARAVAKIRSGLPQRIRREVQVLQDHMAIRLGAATTMAKPGIDQLFAKVQKAQTEHRTLRCRYESKEGKPGRVFLLQPYLLHFQQRAWYVIGHHSFYDEVRMLKLNRFVEMQLTDTRFEVPGTFSEEKYFGNAWQFVRGEKSFNVELIFEDPVAANIADTHWHRTQTLERLPDGKLRFRCKVDGLEEIKWWILARGPHCKVIAPAQLAAMVHDLAVRTAMQYMQ